ncbi:hypothetical protein GHW10_30155 [Pseudomonas aeruginosa]|nr:hypothetical protein [Pseudomonas aeruginosa]
MAGPVRTSGSTAGELLAALADHVAQSAIETLHVNPELAEAHGSEVAAQMAQVWGGQQLYVPKGVHVQVSKLHQQLFDWTCPYQTGHQLPVKLMLLPSA